MKNFTILIIFFCLSLNIQSQVTQQWVQRYNGPANGADQLSFIALDGSGNVYVSGWSLGTGTFQDIVTIKYNPLNGDTLWVNRYAGFSAEIVNAIACDNNSVYVTGWSFTPSRDIITIKYDAVTGNRLWVRTYNGTGNGGDYGFAIAVDPSGNVYVTGSSDIGGAQKFTTIKYDASGNIAAGWPSIYVGSLSTISDQAKTIKVDASGNVYVAGRSGSGFAMDYLTLKINSGGTVLWERKYNGTQNGSDNAVALALDAAGSNVYVGGYSIQSGRAEDYTIIRYATVNGDSNAAVFYNGVPAGQDFLAAMTIDPSDNIYVTGFSQSNTASLDYATVKYNSSLAQQWVQRYNGPGNTADYPFSVAIDRFGNVYVTGQSRGIATGDDYATVMYNSTGNEQWVMRYNGPGNALDQANSIGVDECGNVFVTGQSFGSGTDYDIATIKYRQQTIGEQLTVNAGPDTTIYYGYGTQYATLTALPSGGSPPYSYLWSNSATTQTITVSPNVTTTYTITITDNCGRTASDEVTVNVTDVRCGNNNNKVLVCHNGNTICISSNAVQAHLNHGDHLGPCVADGKANEISVLPDEFMLGNNYPNPFNPVTKIKYGLPFDSRVKVVVYDVMGKEIAVLENGNKEAGYHVIYFDASAYSSGIYYYKLTATGVTGKDFSAVKKMVLIK